MDAALAIDTLVDVVFPLEGTHLPRDHAWPLARALGAVLPWLAAEPLAGFHPVKVVPGGDPVIGKRVSCRQKLLEVAVH